ncbi:MAG: hypothetical protein LC781_03850 [Actinobacteria bacterium]|nr:hypothetical protein [Actinomycetota bacterium]
MSGGVAGVTRMGREWWRRRLLALGCVVTVFGVLHHVDHVGRGNHSGWPFEEAVTPFTFSLLIYALLLPGIFMNLRGWVVAGWWLFVALVGVVLVFFVHFVSAEREAPVRDIYAVYGSPVWGVLALVVLTGLLFGLVTLAVTAFRAVVASRAQGRRR